MTTEPYPPLPVRLEDYDFDYPESLIAEAPAEPRDSSRLLVLDRAAGTRKHARFRDLPDLLRPGDCVVLNRTRVLPARLCGRKTTGGKVELLLVRELGPGRWSALSSDVKPGVVVELQGGARVTIERLDAEGEWECAFSEPDVAGLLARLGAPPLPPYILKRRRASGSAASADLERYQTVYARESGSIAAPTAGLHFTPDLLERLRARGVATAELVLHVGRGTFRPITASDVREHRMLPEWFRIAPEAAAAVDGSRARGGRVVAVGTTAARSLETRAQTGAAEGWTDLYIGPGHAFRAVDAFITNFHLPRSTPLVLACAFAGRERLLGAYAEAVAERYRLYSYGDAMLIL